jgi:hypothetical protein
MKLLNTLSKALLGVGIVDLRKQAYKTNAAAEKAEKFAKDKQIREAVRITNVYFVVGF